ncbi:MAG: hypothetical protein OXH09_07760 [Gammaproteobacteria bacterium]|nr:hypothetical protein [Gammaproteobacteria bacterium]
MSEEPERARRPHLSMVSIFQDKPRNISKPLDGVVEESLEVFIERISTGEVCHSSI